MSDAFLTSLGNTEAIKLERFLNVVTNPSARELLKARANMDTWGEETESFSGLFGYVCGDFVQRYLIRNGEYMEEYPRHWVEVHGNRISVTLSDAARFFQDGNPACKQGIDDTKQKGRDVYVGISQGPAKKYREECDPRLFGVVGLLLGIDMGPGQKGTCFGNGDVELEEVENKARRLKVKVDGQLCSDDFVASVLELYAKKVCPCRVLGKKVSCPHCAMQKPERQVCPYCKITGDVWVCPDCRARTNVTKLPNHGTKGMYCPTDGCHLPVVRGGELLEKFRVASQKPLAAALEELRALQRECLGISAELSWTKLVDQIARLEAASTALERIDAAVNSKNIHDADEALLSAKTEYPDLDYTEFERRIVVLKVSAAEIEIQSLMDVGKFDEASRRMDEAFGISGFDAAKWERAIADAKASVERLAEIKALKDEFSDAVRNGEWDKAKETGRRLAGKGEGRDLDWDREVDEAKRKHKEKLEEERNSALADFDALLKREDLAAARSALEVAKKAHEVLHNKYSVSANYSTIKSDETKLAEKERECRVNGLRPVSDLRVVASTEGVPKIEVSWKPAVDGKADKWRILRRVKGRSDRKQLGDVGAASFVDKDTSLKVGVEYEYGVVPLAGIVISGRTTSCPNESAVVWSATAVCLARLAPDALKGTGEGIDGGRGTVELTWEAIVGVAEGAGCALTLSRLDGEFYGLDVTGKGGFFSDECVTVGRSYEYELALKIGGRDCGASRVNVLVQKLAPPQPVGRLRFSGRKTSDGRPIVEWDWPQGLDVCVWALVSRQIDDMDKVPASDCNKITRATYVGLGGFPLPARNASGWLAVSGVRVHGSQEQVSAPVLLPTGETVIAYVIENHAGSLFSKRKPSCLVITSSTGYLPELEVHAAHTRAEVLSKSGGRIANIISQKTISGDFKYMLDGLVSPGEFVRLYLAKSENCNFVHPKEFEVK